MRGCKGCGCRCRRCRLTCRAPLLQLPLLPLLLLLPQLLAALLAARRCAACRLLEPAAPAPAATLRAVLMTPCELQDCPHFSCNFIGHILNLSQPLPGRGGRWGRPNVNSAGENWPAKQPPSCPNPRWTRPPAAAPQRSRRRGDPRPGGQEPAGRAAHGNACKWSKGCRSKCAEREQVAGSRSQGRRASAAAANVPNVSKWLAVAAKGGIHLLPRQMCPTGASGWQSQPRAAFICSGISSSSGSSRPAPPSLGR